MSAIKRGSAHMKPRRHFALISLLFASGIAGALLVLLYAASLSVFLLRESGAWFAPSFGLRGWFAFARSVPVSHVALVLLFILIFERLMHRYAFVYRRPLVGSFLIIAGFTALGGVLIAQTPFHAHMASYARTHRLPMPLDLPYGSSARVVLPSDMYKGTVVARKENGELVIAHKENSERRQKDTAENEKHFEKHSRRGKKESRIVITPHTRLPRKHNFEIGSTVVVQGDRVGTDTIEAFGVRDVDD